MSINSDLSGSISAEIGKLTHLIVLSLTDNLFTVEILSEIGQKSALQVLDMSQASVSGGVSTELGNIRALIKLNVSSNYIISVVQYPLISDTR